MCTRRPLPCLLKRCAHYLPLPSCLILSTVSSPPLNPALAAADPLDSVCATSTQHRRAQGSPRASWHRSFAMPLSCGSRSACSRASSIWSFCRDSKCCPASNCRRWKAQRRRQRVGQRGGTCCPRRPAPLCCPAHHRRRGRKTKSHSARPRSQDGSVEAQADIPRHASAPDRGGAPYVSQRLPAGVRRRRQGSVPLQQPAHVPSRALLSVQVLRASEKRGSVVVSSFEATNRGLHGHHGNEDRAWFPALRCAGPRIPCPPPSLPPPRTLSHAGASTPSCGATWTSSRPTTAPSSPWRPVSPRRAH